MLQIYFCDITEVIASNLEITNLEKIPLERLEKALKYRNRSMYYQSVFSWFLVRYAFMQESVDITNLVIKYNTYGKPYFNNTYHFSIAHAKNFVVVAISTNEVGIDVEFVDYHKDTSKLIKRVLSDQELAIYNQLESSEKKRYFFEVWTKKEAYIKKMGMSVLSRLTDISVSHYPCEIVFDLENNEYLFSWSQGEQAHPSYFEKIEYQKIMN